MALDQIDIDRIKAEERVRYNVQREIQREGNTTWHSLWNVLNSGITLWFLSSVVISTLTFLYSHHQAAKAASQRCIALDGELRYRLWQFAHRVAALHRDLESNRGMFFHGTHAANGEYGYMGGLHTRYYQAESPQVSLSAEDRTKSIIALLDSFIQQRKQGGGTTTEFAELHEAIKNATSSWQRIMEIAGDAGYDEFHPEKLTPDQYFVAVMQKIDEIESNLSHSELNRWVAASIAPSP
jgi:hypothetical protein